MSAKGNATTITRTRGLQSASGSVHVIQPPHVYGTATTITRGSTGGAPPVTPALVVGQLWPRGNLAH